MAVCWLFLYYLAVREVGCHAGSRRLLITYKSSAECSFKSVSISEERLVPFRISPSLALSSIRFE
jgi:hypothetical protein